MRLALRKRPINDDVIDKAVNGISRSLESKGEIEVKSSFIGEQVMEALKQIDQIAYVRYASVYRNFEEASDFQKFLKREDEKLNKLSIFKYRSPHSDDSPINTYKFSIFNYYRIEEAFEKGIDVGIILGFLFSIILVTLIGYLRFQRRDLRF